MRPLSAARHRAPDPDPPADRGETSAPTPGDDRLLRAGVDKLLAAWLRVLVVANAGLGVALVTNQPGSSPAMQWLAGFAPLAVWSAGFFAVALLLTVGMFGGEKVLPFAHVLAAFCWMAIAFGAALGLVTRATSSPSASIALAVALVAVTALHIHGLLFRRRLARLDRPSSTR